MIMIKWNVVKPAIGPIFYTGYLGKWKTFIIKRSMIRSENKWDVVCKLSGIDSCYGVDSVEFGKKKAEEVLQYWLKESGLNI